MPLTQEVTTPNGVTKVVVGQTQEELDEAVKAVKAEQSAVTPNILDPRDGNKVVSPDNKHTESPYVQPEEGTTVPTAETQGAEKEVVKVDAEKDGATPEQAAEKASDVQPEADDVPAAKTEEDSTDKESSKKTPAKKSTAKKK